jgi:hypothetical protein
MPDQANILELTLKLNAAQSINDLKAATTEIKKARDAVNIGGQESVALNKMLVDGENQLHAARAVGYSDVGKMKEKYFELGTELRSFYQEQRLQSRTFREMGGAVNELGMAFGNEGLGKSVVGALQNVHGMEFAFNGLSLAAQSAGGRIGEVAQSMSGLIMPMTLLAAGVLYAASSYQELEKAAREAGKAAGEAALSGALKRETPEEQIAFYSRERSRLETEQKQKQAQYLGYQAVAKGEFIPGGFGARASEMAYKELAETNKKLTEVNEKIYDLQKKKDDDLGKAAPAFQGADLETEGERFFKLHEYTISKEFLKNVVDGTTSALTLIELKGTGGVSALSPLGAMQYGPSNPEAMGGVLGNLQGVQPRAFSEKEKFTKVAFDNLSIEAQSFYRGMEAMTNSLGEKISSVVGGAFREVFGNAKSWGADLIATFAEAFISQGASSAFTKLFPHASGGMLMEPVMGIGMHSGGIHTFAENGPEMITPYNAYPSASVGSSGEIAALARVIRSGRWDIGGDKLRYVMNKDLNNDHYRRL